VSKPDTPGDELPDPAQPARYGRRDLLLVVIAAAVLIASGLMFFGFTRPRPDQGVRDKDGVAGPANREMLPAKKGSEK